MIKRIKILLILFGVILFISCGKEEVTSNKNRSLVLVEFVEYEGKYFVCKDEDGIRYKVETDQYKYAEEGHYFFLEYSKDGLEHVWIKTYIVNDAVLMDVDEFEQGNVQ